MTPRIGIVYPPYFTRYDKENGRVPFSGTAGRMFLDRTVRLAEVDYGVLLAGHKTSAVFTHYLFLGQENAARYFNQPLNKIRGFRLTYNNKPAIATYSHMECWDFSEDKEANEKTDEKNVGRTKRSNYLFWALADFQKLLRPPQPHTAVNINTSPNIEALINTLSKRPENLDLVIDIETRVQDNSLDAIGLGFRGRDRWWIYSIPIYKHTNELAYSPKSISRLWRLLHTLFLDPSVRVIGHNLTFDLSILHHYYALPIPRTAYDTMIAMHRDSPFIDRSLSHAISCYTDAAVNHKGDLRPNTTADNFQQLLAYNAQDVYWTAEVYARQREKLPTKLLEDAARIYHLCLVMNFTGIYMDDAANQRLQATLSLKSEQLTRVIRILIGRPTFNPASHQQIADFFYRELGYEVINQTESGQPATDEETLLELQLKQPNPVIPILLDLTKTNKQLSMLKIKPYEANKI